MSHQNFKREINWIIQDKYNGRDNDPNLAKDINRLKIGEPVDYIIGWKPFLNCRIDLSFRPLIPRPETEYWTQTALEELRKRDMTDTKILDLFAGSGCLGVAILVNTKNATVEFGEIDKKTTDQIELNLKLNNIPPQRYAIVITDIFKQIKNSYDFILANPPYINPNRLGKVKKSVLDYEPPKALFGGSNGLEIISRFLRQAKGYLKEGGKIYLEFGNGQKREVERVARDCGYSKVTTNKDQFGNWRWATIE